MAKHNKCRGYRLFKLGHYQVELWICPSFEYIEPHSHPEIESKIVLLRGTLFGILNSRSGFLRWLKLYTIKSTDVHSGQVGSHGCIFLNLQRWHTTPTSAAINFKRQ